MIANWYGKDRLNKKGRRNLETTNRRDFNCGGYALETFNWYQPGTEEQNREMFGWCSDMDNEERLELSVNAMLKDFKGVLRVIEDVKELKEDEYAIAFRVCERDFHYAKRNKRGVWFHKTGNAPIVKRYTIEELFSSEWGGVYDSKIVLMAKKKKW